MNTLTAELATYPTEESIALIPPGSVVASTPGSNKVKRASSLEVGRYPAVGLVRQYSETGFVPTVSHAGFLSMDTWTPIIGSADLSPGTMYFLSTTPGKLTTDPNQVGALVSQQIGIAVSRKILLLKISVPILL